MSPRYATISAYRVIFVVFASCPGALSAPSEGSNSGGDPRDVDAIVVIAVLSSVIVLSLGASLVYHFPSHFPAIFRRFRQAVAHVNYPLSIKLHPEFKSRFFTTGRLSKWSEAPATLVNPSPNRSPTQSIPSAAQIHEISSPLSIIFENHSAPISDPSSHVSENQTQDTRRASTGSMPREMEDNADTLEIQATTPTEEFPSITDQLPSEINEDDTHSRDHPPTPEETPLPQSPAPSTRPPTYCTDVSRDSMYTLPLYQENEENQPHRTWSTRSRSTAAAAWGRRSLPRPPLPPSSYPVKS